MGTEKEGHKAASSHQETVSFSLLQGCTSHSSLNIYDSARQGCVLAGTGRSGSLWGMLRSRAYSSHTRPFKNATNTQCAPAPCQLLEQEANPLSPGVDTRVLAPHILLKHLLRARGPTAGTENMQTTEQLTGQGYSRQAPGEVHTGPARTTTGAPSPGASGERGLGLNRFRLRWSRPAFKACVSKLDPHPLPRKSLNTRWTDAS